MRGLDVRRVCVLALALALSRCGSNPAGGDNRYDGSWNGRTDEGTNVSFTVNGSAIVQFRIGFSFAGGCTITADGAPAAAITNGSASFTFNQAGVSVPITATFSSATAGTGTYGQITVSGAPCDGGRGSVSGFRSGGQFTVTR